MNKCFIISILLFFMNNKSSAQVNLNQDKLTDTTCLRKTSVIWKLIKQDANQARYYSDKDFLIYQTTTYNTKNPNVIRVINLGNDKVLTVQVGLMKVDGLDSLGQKVGSFSISNQMELIKDVLLLHCDSALFDLNKFKIPNCSKAIITYIELVFKYNETELKMALGTKDESEGK
jgi:hypothetical protein